ncbi:hypothetical protein [Robertkochia aurantiaca]|uniref:hypothetical protein n=1 Tax=Robertkochia aurantiaca TaxID=2873700 RepID=UPI001CCD94A9|nr:hypothetical protein [Robertkochia sp. 3YJGBD-33]
MLLLFFAAFCRGQQQYDKELDATGIGTVEIDARRAYRIELHTHEKNTVQITAHTEGEIGKDVILSQQHEGSTLVLGTSFSPAFENPGDKLSAHKVISVNLIIYVPASRMCVIQGGNTTVETSGDFEQLSIWNESGPVRLRDVSGRITVETLTGDIIWNGGRADMKVLSKFGRIYGKPFQSGADRVKLSTVQGDVYLNHKE